MRTDQETARHRQMTLANDGQGTEILPAVANAVEDGSQSDPFLKTMFSRMSPGAQHLFTPYQLDEIKRAFAARSFGSHTIDARFSFQIWRRSYYVVFLLGQERRTRARIHVHLPRVVLLILLLIVAGGIYLGSGR